MCMERKQQKSELNNHEESVHVEQDNETKSTVKTDEPPILKLSLAAIVPQQEH